MFLRQVTVWHARSSVLNMRWESVQSEFLVRGKAEPEYLEQMSISFEPIENQQEQWLALDSQ